MNRRVNQERGTGSFWKLGARKAVKILTPSPMPNRNTETAFGGNRREWLYSFCQAREEHSRLVPQELCPPLYPHEGFAFFFFFSFSRFQNHHNWHRATQQPGLVSLKLSACDFLSEMQNATRVGSGEKDVRCSV